MTQGALSTPDLKNCSVQELAVLWPDWEVVERDGPVLTTAIHQGHLLRDELRPFLAVDDDELRRDEDPLTGHWAALGDNVFRTYRSRFEVDLNRPRERAFSADPDETWGRKIWKKPPPQDMVERSLAQHDAFYHLMATWIESLLQRHQSLLLIDLHTYNHRRAGAEQSPSPGEKNPDIDIGATTLDERKFGSVLGALEQGLRETPVSGSVPDVRRNVRYPDGGNFPEWIYDQYGDRVCTVTLEYKKTFMDEWTGKVALAQVDEIFSGLRAGIQAAREELLQCS